MHAKHARAPKEGLKNPASQPTHVGLLISKQVPCKYWPGEHAAVQSAQRRSLVVETCNTSYSAAVQIVLVLQTASLDNVHDIAMNSIAGTHCRQAMHRRVPASAKKLEPQEVLNTHSLPFRKESLSQSAHSELELQISHNAPHSPQTPFIL